MQSEGRSHGGHLAGLVRIELAELKTQIVHHVRGMWDAELEPVVNAAIKDGLIHFEQNLAREIHEQVTRSMQELLKKAVDTVIKENYNLRYAIEKRIEQQAREVVAELLAKPKN